MGQPSFQASNAIVYVTFGIFLYVSGLNRPPGQSRLGIFLNADPAKNAELWGPE